MYEICRIGTYCISSHHKSRNTQQQNHRYVNRHRLGHAKFTFRGTMQRPVSRRGPSENYDSWIYVDHKNERTNKYVLDKHFVGAFETEEEASQAADVAANRRDVAVALRMYRSHLSLFSSKRIHTYKTQAHLWRRDFRHTIRS